MMIPTLNPEQHDSLLHTALHGRRTDVAVLKASGPKLRDYLQGQITQDIKRLTPGQAIYAMALTPQGKAVADLIILENEADADEEEFILLTWRTHAEELVARLRRFAIGYTLRIGIVDDMAVHSVQGAKAASILATAGLPCPEGTLATASGEGGMRVLSMPESSDHGFWLVAPVADLDALVLGAALAVDETVMRAARIRQGHPVFGVDWDASLHPLNANLAEYHGVSFDKGCYVGQEVTSRMQWRGGIKHRLYRLKPAAAPEQLPAPIHTTVAIGHITSAMCDSDGSVYAIGRLPIQVVEDASALHAGDGSGIELVEPCHA